MPEAVAARPRPQVPKINPTVAPFVVCSNRDCERLLTPVPKKGKGGFVPDVTYVCEHCGYEFTLSLVPALGSCRALTEEERDKMEARMQAAEEQIRQAREAAAQSDAAFMRRIQDDVRKMIAEQVEKRRSAGEI